MEELSLRIVSQDGVTRECAKSGQSFTWAGSIDACARTLDAPILEDVPCELGSRVRFAAGGAELLDGFIFERQREMDDREDPLIAISCVDRGLYLKRNEAAYKFTGMTPEAITRRVCADFGVKVGALCETGVAVTRNFPGVSLYAIIATAYSLAAEQTGERYAIRFRGELLEVVAKRKGPETLVLLPGSNLRGGSVTESVENMVNQVAVYDDKGARVATHADKEAVRLYGLMQAYLKQSKGKDSAKEAKKLLEDGGVEQKITVTVKGNHKLISGNCVAMKEPVTGLYGIFWIDADTHVWSKDGDYQTKLTLNFRNIMDEQEAGSLPKA